MPMRTRPQSSCLKTLLRVLAWTLLTCCLLLAVLAGYLFVPVIADPTPGLPIRKGSLQQAEVMRQWQTATTAYSEITLTSSSGLQAELTVAVPVGGQQPMPLVILLGGYKTGRHAAELIQDAHGIVIASLNYPYHGTQETDVIGFLRNVTAMREAVLDTPPVIMLALDYLTTQHAIDKTRIELVGVSFGAFLVSPAGALDHRFKRVWLIHGAGDPAAVFDSAMVGRIKFGPLRRLLTQGFALLIQAHHMKPEKWVGKISPRPVVVVHARNDTSFPRQSIEALHAALQEPYDIIWLGDEHVGVRSQDIIQRIADLIYQRMALDAVPN